MKIKKHITELLVAAAIAVSSVSLPSAVMTASADGADKLSYPVQEFRFGIGIFCMIGSKTLLTSLSADGQ